MHTLLLTLLLFFPPLVKTQPDRPWQLIHDLSRTLRERHGYTGRNIRSEGGLSWGQFRDALRAFREPLENGPVLNLSLGQSLALSAQANLKIERFSSGWFSLHIPARTHPDALIPLLEFALELHYEAIDLELEFKNNHGYHKDGIIDFEGGISMSEHRRGLRALEEAINRYELEEGDKLLFGETRRISFVDTEKARHSQSLDDRISLEIPTSLSVEDYESEVFSPLTLWTLRKRAKHLLRDYFRYRRRNNAPSNFGITDEAFRRTLITMEELLRPKDGEGESALPLDFSNVRHVFISPGDRPWTRRYIGGQVGLHIPVDLPREHFVAALEMALISTENLEARVVEEFQIRGFDGESLRYHADKGRANYREWIENLWLAAKAAPEEALFGGVGGISVTTGEKPRAIVDSQGIVHLDIPLESDPAHLFSLLEPLVNRVLLRRAIEEILWTHSYSGSLEIALGFHDDRSIAEGLRRLKEALDGALSIPDFSRARLTLSPPGERPWAYTFGDVVYLHIPMDIPVEEIIPLMKAHL